MNFNRLVVKSRSFRRFKEQQAVTEFSLRKLVKLARYSPSSANKQFLKYVLSFTAAKNRLIFPHLAWAGYLTGWPGPAEGERPAAYIIIVLDKTIAEQASVDPGIVAQTMLLGAAEQGLGGCMIGSFNRKTLAAALGLPDEYEPQLVLALGKPAERVLLEDAGESIRYYRDEQDVHHVPKRRLEELILDY